mmetsp:Transcript_80318/g.260167  ORF Transcript_80318/g.260167 Transcript_80318/m.260167 type:complete len:259 (+) Transcript_80318:109-885(+)
MPRRRSRSREKAAKDARPNKGEAQPVKQEPAKVSQEIIVLDLDEDDDVPTVVPVKAEVKREVKAEPREKRAKERKPKVKKEKREEDGGDRNREARRRQHSRSRSSDRRRKKRSKSRSSSSGSSSSSESQSDLYRKFKPYTKVQLVNLVRKADLNGMTGQVVHPSTAVSPCPPGCILVRLETGREIAVKPPNITPLRAFHVGPQQAPQTQESRLQQVLSQIKLNVDNVMERTMAIRDTDGSGMLLDSHGAVQGGIGHML